MGFPFWPRFTSDPVSNVAVPAQLFDRDFQNSSSSSSSSNATQTNGSYCGNELAQLNKQIAGDLSNTISLLEYLGNAFNSSTMPQDTDLSTLTDLIDQLGRNLALINWVCVSNDLSTQMAATMNSLLVQVEHFLLGVLHHVVNDGSLSDHEWQVVLGAPTSIAQMLERVSGIVVVFKLTVWKEIMNVRTLVGIVKGYK